MTGRRLAWMLMVGMSLLPVAVRVSGQQPSAAPQQEWVEVDLFDAIDAGQLRTNVVADGYTQMTLTVRNETPQTLRVTLPEVFAALPTARRQMQQTMQRQGVPDSLAFQYAQNQGGSQGLGGSLGDPWLWQSPNAAGAQGGSEQGPAAPDRFWVIPPRQPVQFRLPCFCLEYGKPDPNRRIPYELARLTELNGHPAVRELLDRFGKGGCDQRVAQLAVWHVANGVPWPVLARIELARSGGRGTRKVAPVELVAAKQLAESLPSYGAVTSLSER